MAKADENWDKYLRAVAELENVRKRAVRDVEKARKYAVESFAKELLVVIDSFEMAMGSEDIELKDLISGTKSLQGPNNESMVSPVFSYGEC